MTINQSLKYIYTYLNIHFSVKNTWKFESDWQVFRSILMFLLFLDIVSKTWFLKHLNTLKIFFPSCRRRWGLDFHFLPPCSGSQFKLHPSVLQTKWRSPPPEQRSTKTESRFLYCKEIIFSLFLEIYQNILEHIQNEIFLSSFLESLLIYFFFFFLASAANFEDSF